MVDPLKLHTYGIKKPLDQKEERINQLYQENKRYYPQYKNGQVDEWGAVIKHQTEQFEQERQQFAMLDQQ